MKVFSIIKYTCILNYKIKRKSLIYTINYSIWYIEWDWAAGTAYLALSLHQAGVKINKLKYLNFHY